MERIFGRPIVTQEEMRARIRELGKQITTDYTGKDIVLVGGLKGAYAFYADLARAIRIPIRIDFLMVTSYGSRAKTSGKVKMVTELTEDIKGKDVLLVEDIVDSGLTVQYLVKTLTKKRPRSIKVCTLLSKPDRRTIDVAIDYVGFNIPNKYVVGYGLDYQQKYRNLPYLAVLDVAEDQE
ncbi:MAG: hypoxanthine phosphoribosyltransferase [Nitrospirae bacterium RBG_19FT_COMBO_58_9]|nr:MAG: hypoxanthine phosphoribosyltransferase [Nitrospirae bacterium RBG_19FT_COMBO_58_9]